MAGTIRTAKLFEAGKYPDKGLEASAEDLQKLADNFREIPVKVEHTDTVFDGRIGKVKEVWCSGGSLYGSIEFEPDMWALMDSIGAKSLSVGIKPDMSELTEVSIVKSPRIADARIFCFSDFGGGDTAAENRKLRQELKEIRMAVRKKEAENRAEEYIRQGVLTPAVREEAAVLLSLDGTVEFGESTVCAGAVFEKFLDKLPGSRRIEMHIDEEQSVSLSPEQLRVLKGLGADPQRTAKYMEDK